MKKVGMKRWLSMLLSIILFAGCIGVMTPATESKAEGEATYETVTLPETINANLNGKNASNAIYYNVDITANSLTNLDSDLASGSKNNTWDLKIDWEVDVVVNDEQHKATVNYTKGGKFNFFHTRKADYEVGTVFTIKEGRYLSSDLKYGFEFTKDYTYVWNGTQLITAHVVSFADSISGYWGGEEAPVWNFAITQKIPAFDTFVWDTDAWTVQAYVDGVRKDIVLQSNQSQNKFDVQNTGLSLAAPAGTLMTFDSGIYLNKSGKYAMIIEDDCTYAYKGSGSWQKVTSVNVSFTGTSTYSNHGKTEHEFTFDIPNEIQALSGYTNWDTDYWTIPLVVGDRTYNFTAHYVKQHKRFDFVRKTETENEKTETGTVLIIPKGSYLSVNYKYQIYIDKDYTFVWNGSNWIISNAVTFKVEHESNWWTASQSRKANKFYVKEAITSFETDGFWNSDYWTIPVEMNGSSTTVEARYASGAFDFIFSIDVITDKPAEGTTIKIPAGVYLANSKTRAIQVDKDYTFVWHGSKWMQIHYEITEYRSGEAFTYPSIINYVFAGWYEDAEYTKAIGTDVKTGYAYAKFVPKAVAGVHFQKKANGDNTDVRMITTVDTLSYTNVGFQMVKTVSGKNYGKTVTSDTVYHSVKGGGETYTPQSVGGEAANFFMTAVLSVPNSTTDTTLTVTAFWTTLDGTKVLGETRTLTNDQLVTVEASGN